MNKLILATMTSILLSSSVFAMDITQVVNPMFVKLTNQKICSYSKLVLDTSNNENLSIKFKVQLIKADLTRALAGVSSLEGQIVGGSLLLSPIYYSISNAIKEIESRDSIESAVSLAEDAKWIGNCE